MKMKTAVIPQLRVCREMVIKNKELELTRENENSCDMDEGVQGDGRKTNEELELTKENEKSCDSMDEGTQEQKGHQCISLFFSGENL